MYPRIYDFSKERTLSLEEISLRIPKIDSEISECLSLDYTQKKKLEFFTKEKLVGFAVFRVLKNIQQKILPSLHSPMILDLKMGEVVFFPFSAKIEEEKYFYLGKVVMNFSFPKVIKIFFEVKESVLVYPFEDVVKYRFKGIISKCRRKSGYFSLSSFEKESGREVEKIFSLLERKFEGEREVKRDLLPIFGIDGFENSFVKVFSLEGGEYITKKKLKENSFYIFPSKFFEFNYFVFSFFNCKISFVLVEVKKILDGWEVKTLKNFNFTEKIPMFRVPEPGEWVILKICSLL